MKPYLSSFLLTAALSGAASAQTNFPDGLSIGPTGSGSEIIPLSMYHTGGLTTHSVRHAATTGGLLFYSGQEEIYRGYGDGGVTAYGNPVNIVLGTDSDPMNYDRGIFAVWKAGQYTSWGATPLFSISSPSQVATFEGVNVVVNNGTLTVAGSQVLTQANSGSYLDGQGYLKSSTLVSITPPTTSSWTNTYVPRGAVSNGGALALGGSVASATNAIACGPGSTTAATAQYSQAYGVASLASGIYAYSHGWNSSAEGVFSSVHGLQLAAKSADETVFGRYNVLSSPSSTSSISGLDGLLRLGNGTSTTNRSDALTVLKSGETTLTNKEWKAAVTADSTKRFDDPASTTDSNGNALVVDGHARLRGKVLIQPQGDLSMGSFTAGEAP